MREQIEIWLVGNTGLRNPNRIQEGFSIFAASSFVGNLHGREIQEALFKMKMGKMHQEVMQENGD